MEIVVVAEMEQRVNGKFGKCFNQTVWSGNCKTKEEAYVSIHKQYMKLCSGFEKELGGSFIYNWMSERIINNDSEDTIQSNIEVDKENSKVKKALARLYKRTNTRNLTKVNKQLQAFNKKLNELKLKLDPNKIYQKHEDLLFDALGNYLF